MLGHNRVPVTDWQLSRGNWNFTDDAGAQGAFTVFTVTGDVLVRPFAICDVLLAGATATIELGISGNTPLLIAQTTAANIALNEIWQDATPTATAEALDLNARNFIIAGGQDIIQTIATADLTAGDLDYHCLWRALSPGASVVAT